MYSLYDQTRYQNALTSLRRQGTMLIMYVSSAFGAFKPLRALKKVGKVVTAPVRAVGALALKPLRSHINKLTTRRARKLAWDRRRSKTPTPAERAEARAWTKRKLKAKGPHGSILALLAGAHEWEGHEALGAFGVAPGTLGIEPATITLLTASLPAFIALVKGVLASTSKSGEAPVDPETSAAPPAAPMPTEIVEEEAMAGAYGYFSDSYFGDELGAVLSPRVAAGIVIGLGAAAAATGLFMALRQR